MEDEFGLLLAVKNGRNGGHLALRRSVQPSHQQNIAIAKGSYRFPQCLAVCDGSADLLCKYPLSASGGERGMLSVEGLAVR